eukprot:6998245-Pyramimonas_sp.AAC.1
MTCTVQYVPLAGSRGIALGPALVPSSTDASRSGQLHRVLYVAVKSKHAIWALDTETGVGGALAGGNMRGMDDGPSHLARFAYPTSVAVSQDGNVVFVADFLNDRVRAIEMRSSHGGDSRPCAPWARPLRSEPSGGRDDLTAETRCGRVST